MMSHAFLAIGCIAEWYRRTGRPIAVAAFEVGGIMTQITFARRIVYHIGNVQLQGRDDSLKEVGGGGREEDR